MLHDAAPEAVGLNPGRLARLDQTMRQRVTDGVVPGAVVLVARRGRTAFHAAYGRRDAIGSPVTPDTIFRIASMTKPLTSLAVMMLVERGLLALGTPLSQVMPAFADARVAVPQPDGSLTLKPMQRAPTILDLLRHTAGISSGWFGTSPVKKLYAQAALYDEADSAADYLAKLAALPLEFQPGSTWTYSEATGLLGHLVEAVTNVPLDQFLAEHVTGPLGMVDTGFCIPEPAQDRLAAYDGVAVPADVRTRPARFMGGGGLVSTAMDYARFCQFWLEGGALDGVRLVSRKTVELMTADHLPPGVAFDPDAAALFGPRLPAPECGRGFGLGFAVRTSMGRAPWHGSVGAFDWIGATGCTFIIDPAEDLLAVLLAHAPTQLVSHMNLLRALVYQAIDD